MTTPKPWTIPLNGTPCIQCGQPADHVSVYPAGRVIVHNRGIVSGPCALANPIIPVQPECTMAEDTHTTALDQLADWIEAYRRAHEQAGHYKNLADNIQKKITNALDKADATVGTVAGAPVVRWVPVTSYRIDTVTLRAEHPIIAADYSVPIVSRRFTVVGPAATLAESA
jgi:hypothetical protein